MLFFTNWVNTPDEKYLFGWLMCGIIVINILFNMSFVLYYGGKGVLQICKKAKRKFKNATRAKYFDSYDDHAEQIERMGIQISNRVPVTKGLFDLSKDSNPKNHAKIKPSQ